MTVAITDPCKQVEYRVWSAPATRRNCLICSADVPAAIAAFLEYNGGVSPDHILVNHRVFDELASAFTSQSQSQPTPVYPSRRPTPSELWFAVAGTGIHHSRTAYSIDLAGESCFGEPLSKTTPNHLRPLSKSSARPTIPSAASAPITLCTHRALPVPSVASTVSGEGQHTDPNDTDGSLGLPVASGGCDGKCLCGCGGAVSPGRNFLPGHDSKFRSMVLKFDAGKLALHDLPTTVQSALSSNHPQIAKARSHK